jgi:nucleotide-binding universal stress UspA family protein
MITHLLVPLDGSRMAEAALPAAAHLAEKCHARVTLVHVIEKNAPRVVHGQQHLQYAEEAVSYLALARNFFPVEVPIESHVHEVKVDNVAESVVAHAVELNADLIVMCSHGRGRALHLFLGSIAQKVVAMGTLPVLITHPHQTEEPLAFSIKSILVPLDGEPDHEKAIPFTKELAGICGASLHLALVVPRFGVLSGGEAVTSRFLPGTMSRFLDLSVKEAQDYLQMHLEALRNQGVSATATLLRGDPAAEIIDLAQMSGRMDLVVLATHGKTGMDAFWAGSVAHQICSRCRIPLLMIPVNK